MQHHSDQEKPKKGFLQIIWDILFVFFYPILTTFALLVVGLVNIFSFLSGLLSYLIPTPRGEKEEAQPEWEPFANCQHFTVEYKLVDEIMFGPAYYNIRTKPAPATAPGDYYGDFKFECFGGVLLQRWNSITPKDLPDFDLVFLNGETAAIQKIQTIKAFTWQAHRLDEDTVQLKWTNGNQEEILAIHRKDVVSDFIATDQS